MNMITDYEVEGCWTSLGGKNPARCRKCGEVLVICPDKDHYNSKFWELKRNDGLDLFICPNGCSEKEAVLQMRKFLMVRDYCLPKSKSYKYNYNWEKIANGWIDEKGIFYPCDYKQHIFFLEKFESDIMPIKNNQYGSPVNWIKICQNDIFMENDCNINKKQQIAIMDYYNNKNMKIPEITQGFFKFKI